MNENSRLDRIEEKLDRVVETLQMLARIDERQDAFEQRLNRHELRIDLIEKDVNDHGEALAASTGKGSGDRTCSVDSVRGGGQQRSAFFLRREKSNTPRALSLIQ